MANDADPSDDNAMRGAAYHEAGHAVVAYYYGCRVTRLHIHSENGSAHGGTATDRWSEHEPEILAAGRICAEAFGFQQSATDTAQDDRKLVSLLSKDLSSADEDEVLEGRLATVHNQVTALFERPDFRAAAAALAERLLVDATIGDMNVVEAIIGRHLRRHADIALCR
jgi:hypothetical protein